MLFIVAFSYSIALASTMELQYDGETHLYEGPNVNLILNGEPFIPSEGQMPPIIIQDRTLVPVREVFEKLGGEVIWTAEERKVDVSFGEKTISLWLDKTTSIVDGKEITLDVPAKLINAKTMVPVRFISENGGLIVGWDGTTTTVTVDKPDTEHEIVKITSVKFDKINNADCIVATVSDKTTYKAFDIKSEGELPTRIILDIDNSKFDFDYQTITVSDSDVLSQIRFGVQENDVNRIVLDMKQDAKYSVVQTEDGKNIYLALTSNFALTDNPTTEPSDQPGETEPAEPANTKPGESEVTEPTQPQDEEPASGNESTEPEPVPENKPEITSKITSIKYSTASEKVRIILDSKFEYELTELENPKRIVLDFKNSALKLEGPDTITLKNNAISTVVASTNEDGTARIEITMSNNASFELSKKTSELQVKVEQPSYKDVEYTNKGDYAEIILSDVDLNALTKLQSKTTKKYTIKYSSSKFNPGSGAIEIDDEFVKKITVTSTKITISDAGNVKYTAVQKGNDVVFTIKKANAQEEKIILLDAGHGGNDPGAINGSDNEKTLNLKIMLKLKDLLENAGYTVYTTRESDVTLTVNDRVYLATKDYPEASLYVSVHNNSLDNKNYSGTLVMYCNRDTSSYGITNKEFASYVLNELVDNLGTINRGFIEVKENDTSKRVLTEVPMPSILCEVAFVSNDQELARLKTDKFQSQAAEAIFNGIEKALNKMN